MERPLTQNIRSGEAPLSLREYERAGGYQAVRKALRHMQPTEVTDAIKAAVGGPAFPPG